MGALNVRFGSNLTIHANIWVDERGMLNFSFLVNEDSEHCYNCGHLWVPEIENPMACPKCSSRNFRKFHKEYDDEKARCLICRLTYQGFMDNNEPIPYAKSHEDVGWNNHPTPKLIKKKKGPKGPRKKKVESATDDLKQKPVDTNLPETDPE